MSTINPQTLSHLRRKRDWSLSELAEKSGINKSTIHRIEKGGPSKRGHNDHTIKQLAKALGSKMDDLCAPLREDEAQSEPDRLFRRRSTPGLKMSDASQNALQLVAIRYGVKPEEVLDIAPLLFDLVAMESLINRAMQLREFNEQKAILAGLGSSFPHMSEKLFESADADEIEGAESRSIELMDVLGQFICDKHLPYDYDEETDNPLVTFLRNQAQKVAEKSSWKGDVEGWSFNGPTYTICEDLATGLAAKDHKIAHSILSGHVKIADMPSGLLAADKVAERLEWLRESEEAWQRDFERTFPNLKIILDNSSYGEEAK
jgi:transcriptional regulator with XRE-family HTH domain